MNRAYYSDSIYNFYIEDKNSIYGKISGKYDLNKLAIQQSNAWKNQIKILKQTISNFNGKIYFEFTIPRMGKRVDNILIIDNCIFVLEFKIGSNKYDKHAKDQAFDYGLDLNNFHEGSHGKVIIPVLVADKASNFINVYKKALDNLHETIVANENNLSKVITETLSNFKSSEIINIENWENSIYKPTPTIIEAATALYKKHNVSEISRSDSGAENLSVTSECISKIIDYSKNKNRKSICFITGVPGAGKTLAGLNIANLRSNYQEEEHAVFLSGNGPLVDVLKEALARDKVKTAKDENSKIKKEEARSQVKSFIQNIHNFRDDAIKDPKKSPNEKVAIFDEAQRAWTKEKATSFMKRNKGISDFSKSEPEFLIEVMNRHQDWCAIICLIGGGQEINIGEAGLEEWIRPFSNKFKDWDIYYSSKIIEDENYVKDKSALIILNERKAIKKDELHLSISLRSFRSAQLSDFIQEIINNNIENAKITYDQFIKKDYPIKITRDLNKAKNWLKKSAKGSERIGIVASSGGIRLRPFGLNVKAKIDAPIWFLNDKDDIRSSHFLEEVATEFDIQGLELDWTCVAWDGDLFYDSNRWNYKKFSGTTWKNINPIITNYLINSYRVLLTRARQGMIIYIPFGNNEDITRPEFMYDGTFEFFKSLGIEEI